MLLALTRPSCSADLSKLDIQWMSYQADGVIFQPAHLAKQSRSSKHLADFFFPRFKDDPVICPVITLRTYEKRTKEFRDLQSPSPKTTLFLSWIGKHNLVTSSTIARWLNSIMSEAGIDVGIFKSHSVRGATCTKAAGVGVTLGKYWMQQIGPLKTPFNGFITGKWRTMTELVLVEGFCHPTVLQTIHVDMKQSLLRCNLRMA